MRMLLLATLLVLAACGSKPALIRTNTVVVMPEEALFNCPTVDTLPQSATLTDVQVARLIVQLYQNNAVCKNSMTALRTFLENAQRTTQQPSN